MINVILGSEKRPGVWSWECISPRDGKSYSGFSRAPLLDACRALKRAGENTLLEIGLFGKDGNDAPLIRTTIRTGASLTVSDKVGNCKFADWMPNLRFAKGGK